MRFESYTLYKKCTIGEPYCLGVFETIEAAKEKVVGDKDNYPDLRPLALV